MNQTQYLLESARTVSSGFHAEVISPHDAVMNLLQFEALATVTDQYKKSLFYGKPFRTTEVPLTDAPADVTYNFDIDELHAILGVVTEAAELSQALRECWATPTEEHQQHVLDETGDILWYLAVLLRAHGVDFEKVMAANIAKLKARFPEKFEASQAITRDTVTENKALSDSLKSA